MNKTVITFLPLSPHFLRTKSTFLLHTCSHVNTVIIFNGNQPNSTESKLIIFKTSQPIPTRKF